MTVEREILTVGGGGGGGGGGWRGGDCDWA